MRTKYKQWAVDFLDEHPEIVIEKINLDDCFFAKPIFIEIGSGKGDFIVGTALKHPENNYLAVEKVKTVSGMMSKKIVDNDVKNIRVFANDAQFLFEQIPENFVNGIFLNFVDPWPKKKHAKRRLTFHTFLEQYYKILKPGAKLIFKSDNDGLYAFTLEEIDQTKFKLITNEEDYKFDEENDVMTEYENKFRSLGQKIHRIILIK